MTVTRLPATLGPRFPLCGTRWSESELIDRWEAAEKKMNPQQLNKGPEQVQTTCLPAAYILIIPNVAGPVVDTLQKLLTTLAVHDSIVLPIDSRRPALEVVDSWLEHSAAAEYLCVGRSTLYRYSERMLTLDEERRILNAAPDYLRVAIILLSQTGGRTYSEGFSLRWSQVDFERKVIRLDNNVKTPGSAEPIPLSQYACQVLQAWKKQSAPVAEYVFPSPIVPGKPLSTVKTAWKATLKRAGVTPFPIYNLRHVFCTRLSEVAADAVVECAMRHTSPETKRHYQLGMAEQVREAVEKTNKRLYGKTAALHFRDSSPQKGEEPTIAACK